MSTRFDVYPTYFLWIFFFNLSTTLCYADSSFPITANCCGPSCRVRSEVVSHYDERYFQWQNNLTYVQARRHQGETFIQMFEIPRSARTVADFGAGGGHVIGGMTNIPERWIVDVNPYARKYAETEYGLHAVAYPEDLPDNFFDVIFSISAIEHMECPIQELREVFKKIKPGGKIVVGIKNEGPWLFNEYSRNDINNHLYTWHKQSLGNLLKAAGFHVSHINPVRNGLEEALSRCKKINFDHYDCFLYLYAYGEKPCDGCK